MPTRNWEQLVPTEEIGHRLETLQARMQEARIEAALVIQRVDLFYLTGTAQNAYLFVPASGAPLLMVKKYYSRARQESPLEQVMELGSVRDLPHIIEDHYGELPRNLGLEMDVLPFREFQFLKSLFDCEDLRDISPLILRCRGVKSAWEIRQLQSASSLSQTCFNIATVLLRSQKDPIETASYVQAEARRFGHGARIRLRHYYEKALPFTISALCLSDGSQTLTSGNHMVELDFKWVLNGYHLLEARLFKRASLSAKGQRAVQHIVELHNFLGEQARPGTKAGDLFHMAREKAKSLGCDERLVGMDMRDRPSRLAPLGHGIGLELREPPWISARDQTRLQPNMVLAIRPALVIENGLVMSMSSVIRITEEGSEYLSKVPREVL